jgi:hypothetical protein
MIRREVKEPPIIANYARKCVRRRWGERMIKNTPMGYWGSGETENEICRS